MNKQQKRAEKRLRRRSLTAQRNRARAQGFNLAGWAANIERAIMAPLMRSQKANERRALMNAMTQWQRTQALRECRGDLKNLSTERMVAWLKTPHRKAGAAVSG